MLLLVLFLLLASALVLVLFPLWGFYIQIVLNAMTYFIVLLITKLNGYRIERKYFRMKSFENPIQFAFYVGLLQIILLVSFGFIIGFGKSPFSHTPLGLIINFMYVLFFVLGREFSRAFILHKFKKYSYIIFVVAILYTILNIIPYIHVLTYKPLTILKFLGANVIPTFTQQLFASILAYYSGAYASSVYMGVIMGFEWLSPFLPNLDWMLKSFLTTLAPALGYLIMSSEVAIRKIKIKREESNNALLSWAITIAICMLILLFFTGKLGYHPAVVGSGSMTPTICVGDIVIVKNIKDPYEIHVGDIVQYKSDSGITITHRVIKIIETPNGLMFVTKGDANNVADKPFPANRIVGKVVFVIPKLGLIPLVIRNLIWRMLRGG